jgi:hypothetical protein
VYIYTPDNKSEHKFTRELNEFVYKGFKNTERVILKQMIFSISILCFRALDGNCVYSKRKVPTRTYFKMKESFCFINFQHNNPPESKYIAKVRRDWS